MEEQQSRRPETGDSHEYRLRFSLARSLQTKESPRKTEREKTPFLSFLPKVAASLVCNTAVFGEGAYDLFSATAEKPPF